MAILIFLLIDCGVVPGFVGQVLRGGAVQAHDFSFQNCCRGDFSLFEASKPSLLSPESLIAHRDWVCVLPRIRDLKGRWRLADRPSHRS